MKRDNRLTASLGLLAAAFALGACSHIPGVNRLAGEEGIFRDRQGDYLEAETIPRTRVPDYYDSQILDDLYVVPQVSRQETVAFLDAPRPRPIEGKSDREVVIQSLGDNSWVVVDASPGQVWPRLRDYWTSQRVPLIQENPSAGLMETSWMTVGGETLTKEQFRISVEPGFQDNSSEIRLLHREAPQAVPTVEVGDWPEASQDPELAREMLTDMAGYLAEVADIYRASSVSFLAGSISSQGKASLRQGEAGAQSLHLRETDYARGWAAVVRALERAGVEVTASDQERGLIEVSYSVPVDEEEKGFFTKLFTLDALRRNPDQDPWPLLLQLREEGEAVEVRADNLAPERVQESREAPAAPADSLLRTLRSNIA